MDFSNNEKRGQSKIYKNKNMISQKYNNKF